MYLVNDTATVMYNKEFQGMSLIKEANICVLYAAASEKDFILATTQKERDEFRHNWEVKVAEAGEALDKASDKFVTEAGIKVIKEAQAAYLKWKAATTRVIELRSKESFADNAESMLISKTETYECVKTLMVSIGDATTRKENNAKALNETGNSLFASSVIILSAFIVVAVLLGLVIGIALSGSVLKTVGGEPSEIAGIADDVAKGNLKLDTSHIDTTTGIHKSLLLMIEKLKEIAGGISSASNQVSAGSQQLSSTAQQMSQGATEQASSVEEISSSMEEMTSNIRQNAENAQMTEKIARKTAADAESGGKAVVQTVEAMKLIASKTGIIEEIARSNEHARAERLDRGRARGRIRKRLRGRRLGSRQARRAQPERSGRNQFALGTERENRRERRSDDQQHHTRHQTNGPSSCRKSAHRATSKTRGQPRFNAAILQLDRVVQQNASASEESASMSEELAAQSEQMQSTISFFKLDGEQGTAKAKVNADRHTVRVAHIATGPRLAEKSPVPVKTVGKKELQTARKGITLNLDDDDAFGAAHDAADSDFKEF